MFQRHILCVLAAALAVSSLPLNINLGAYSPALVVGDGEISFGGEPQRASEILQTLASGAANGAIPPGTGPRPGTAPAAAAPEGGRPVPQPAAAAPAQEGQPAPGVTSPIVGGTPAPAPQAANVETNAQAQQVTPSVMPAEFISHKINAGVNPSLKYPNMVKRSQIDPGSAAERSEIAKLRVKRDIDGFREALAYARDALRNSPRVELGTDAAGIGILVNAGQNVPPNSAANGAPPPGGRPARLRKRAMEPEAGEKLGVTLIAISEI
jgi:hypothetical protein